ncbi:hypothetical protein [Desulforamulus putei]|uniref:hypothetical protein n=1 Tax=Desulforamulus putei TaxID=74701 RepID=UPI002FDEC038
MPLLKAAGCRIDAIDISEKMMEAGKAGFKTLYTEDAVVYVYLGVNENRKGDGLIV